MRFILMFGFIHFISICFGAVYHINPAVGSMQNDGSYDKPWSTVEDVINGQMIMTHHYTLPYDETSTLRVVNPNGLVKGGDTLMLYDGLHGVFRITGGHNLSPITVIAAEGHNPILHTIHLRSGSNWTFDGLTISSEPYGDYGVDYMLWLDTHGWQGPVSDVVIRDCDLFSTINSEMWSADDWNTKARSGIRINADRVLVSNCKMTNVNFGVTCIGDSITVSHSLVANFSGDGMRSLGPNNIIEYNVIKNCYNVNDNHDDGIQSFNLDTYDTRNVIIRGNIIINNENPDHPLAGPLQGVGCFDGPFDDWVIENNVIHVDHWHGISLYGAYRCIIRNNTVLDPSPDLTPGPSWIRINPDKDGTPSSDNIVANNISNSMALSGSNEYASLLIGTTSEYNEQFVDYNNYDFSLLSASRAVDAGIDSLASSDDIRGVIRPQGQHSDVGAYELELISSTIQEVIDEWIIYPNPAGARVIIPDFSGEIEVYDRLGQSVLHDVIDCGVLDISALSEGLYLLCPEGRRCQKVVIK